MHLGRNLSAPPVHPDRRRRRDGAGHRAHRVESVTVSADGEIRLCRRPHSSDHADRRFNRNRNTGALVYPRLVSGQMRGLPADPDRVPGGRTGSGLANVRTVILSRDGEFAYGIASRRRRGRPLHQDPSRQARPSRAASEATRTRPAGGFRAHRPPAPTRASTTPSRRRSAATGARSTSPPPATPRSSGSRGIRAPESIRGCITGETETGPAGSGACRRIDDAAPAGGDSGLSDARGLAISPDQRWLYGVATDDDSVFRFRRSRRTGKLTYRGCISGDSGVVPACRAADPTSPGGGDTGFDQLRSLAISRDGKSLYAVSRDDDGVVEFRRKLSSGRLVQKRCHSGDSGAASGDPCVSAGVPALFGEDSGLDGAEGVVVSRDGRTVYVSTAFDSSVVRFKRARRTGRLTFTGCDSGDFETGHFVGTAACSELAFRPPRATTPASARLSSSRSAPTITRSTSRRRTTPRSSTSNASVSRDR